MAQLTEKQNRFISHYVNNGHNAAEAYRASGYACGSDNSAAAAASRLLRNPTVSRVLTRQTEVAAEAGERQFNITRDFLIAKYIDIIEGAMADKRPQYGAARASLADLAHITGHWVDRREISGSVDHVMTELTTDDLLELIAHRDTKVIDNTGYEVT
jgi:phage terminase small subunit